MRSRVRQSRVSRSSVRSVWLKDGITTAFTNAKTAISMAWDDIKTAVDELAFAQYVANEIAWRAQRG